MRCEAVQLALSAAMDGPPPISAAAREHAAGCPRCTRFERGAWRVRELTRFEVAPPVPDLMPAIMAMVEAPAAPRIRPLRRPSGRGPSTLPVRAAVVALVAGILIGAVVTSGGLIPRERGNVTALAAGIPRSLLRTAAAITGYRATFEITESHWTKAVPRRSFVADVAFLAPEDFSVQVRDTTPYPPGPWPRNDLSLVTDGRAWRETGPDPCPAAALPACPDAGPVTRSTVGRAPFDPGTAMPTDVIVPMTVLAASDRVEVVGSGRVAGRAAVAVELAYRDASSLFGYLTFLGSWRPFFSDDRVVVWLDAGTWFPLRYQVFPSPGAERVRWASQVGLPPEPPGRAVFEAAVRSAPGDAPPAAAFRVRPGASAVDEGFRDRPFPDASEASQIPLPSRTQGLRLVRYGEFERTPARPYRETVAAFANGLQWLTVTVVTGWARPRPFGVDGFAEPVGLRGLGDAPDGVGYYEPASAAAPRRIALHTSAGEILVAANLPRTALLDVAASLPFGGLSQPARWRIHRGAGGIVEDGLTPDQAIDQAGFDVLLPTFLPPGYRAVAAESVRGPNGDGVTIVLRRPAAELDGDGILLYQATGQTIPPPTEAGGLVVAVDGSLGRWSPQAHRLEWMDGSIYRSLSCSAFDLGTLIQVATSLGDGA